MVFEFSSNLNDNLINVKIVTIDKNERSSYSVNTAVSSLLLLPYWEEFGLRKTTSFGSYLYISVGQQILNWKIINLKKKKKRWGLKIEWGLKLEGIPKVFMYIILKFHPSHGASSITNFCQIYTISITPILRARLDKVYVDQYK